MASLLVADDNLRDHERYAAFLAGTGLGLLCCRDGAEALRLVAAHAPELAAAVVLWELPGNPTGSELVPRLALAQPELPVLVVSGLLDFSRAARARALGACDFLLKPLERERLRAAVEGALRRPPEHPLLPALRARLLGESPALLDVLRRLALVIARPGEAVLLIGENGTGKEILARAVHDLGAAGKGPWVPVNVASIPPPLLESTLFGHEAGAFTDARGRRVGLFEECGDGTLFLDEIGELDLALQAKLLRAVQERTFRRVGGGEDLRFAARLVCATNRDLIADKEAGRFRPDLYYRIAANEVRLPPLRERGDDLWLLVEHFLKKHGRGRDFTVAREARQLLAAYPFPGNVRELEDVVRHALLRCPDGVVLPYHLPVEVMQQRQAALAPGPQGREVAWPARLFELPQKEAVLELERAFDRDYLARRLKEAGGNVTRAARAASLDPKTFRKKWEQAGLGPLTSSE